MSSGRTYRLLVWAAATDRTFRERTLDGRRVLTGKCIHCNRPLTVELDSRSPQVATVEHIVPRTHGGTDAIDNLAVACRRCNVGKGKRLDRRHRDDETLNRVLETLQQRRRARMREPPENLALPAAPEP
jgi:5-methylcytosine-specific restriction endonuclease McrA